MDVWKKTKNYHVNINPKYLDLKQTLKIKFQIDKCGTGLIAKKHPIDYGIL